MRVDDVREDAMHAEDSPNTHNRAARPGEIRPQPTANEPIDLAPAGPPAPDGGAARPRTPAGGAYSPDRLHVCFHCAGELAYPLDWSEEGLRHWRIVLRCPECESRREGVFEQTAVELLDDELDRAASALLGDLRRMTHANMSEEVEFFIRALDADLIVPSDF
jgi:hypothetical protein